MTWRNVPDVMTPVAIIVPQAMHTIDIGSGMLSSAYFDSWIEVNRSLQWNEIQEPCRHGSKAWHVRFIAVPHQAELYLNSNFRPDTPYLASI